MDQQMQREKLQREFMSWNYWDLLKRADTGGGVHDTLRQLPLTFTSAEVLRSHTHSLSCHCLPLAEYLTASGGGPCSSADHRGRQDGCPTTSQEYVSLFEPLVLEECGALLMRGNEEGVICLPHVAAIAGVEEVKPDHFNPK